MKENKRNIHDTFFKKVFGNMTVTKEFLENYLPSDILSLLDLENLQKQNDTFIDKKLEQYFTDTLYSVKMGSREAYLYILFEHKSYPDKGIAFQLLEYMAKIYRKHRKEFPNAKVPVVIPIVIYHGETLWKYPLDLISYMDIDRDKESSLLPYIPNFNYKFYDVTRMKKEDFHGNSLLFATLIAFQLKGKKSKFTLEEIVKRFDAIGDEDYEMFQVLCEYMAKILDESRFDEFFTIIENSDLERREDYMTIAQVLEKRGRDQGLKEGLREGLMEGKIAGLREGKMETAANLLKMKLDLHMIAQATELPLEEIEKLSKKIKS